MFQITSINPNNNAIAIDTDSVIEVVFNKFVKKISNDSLYLTKKGRTKKIPVNLIKVSDNEWKIVPKTALSLNMTYVIHATSEIQSIDNDSLDAFTSQFKTKFDNSNPVIIKTYPSDNQSHVKTNCCMEVIFSEPVYDIDKNSFILRKKIDSVEIPIDIETEVSQYSPMSWRLIPLSILEPQTDYVIKLLSSIRDDQGNFLQETLINFTTEFNNVLPVLISEDPAFEEVGVPVNKVLSLNFSEPIYNVSESTVSLLKEDMPITKTVTTPGPSEIQITPSDVLDLNTLYTIKAEGITDDAGNIVDTISYSFRTTFSNDPLSVSELIPSNNTTGVLLDSRIFIQFNRPVYDVSNETLFLTDDQNTIIPSTLIKRDDFSYFIKSNDNLNAQSAYHVYVIGVKDDQGVEIDLFTSSFTTEYSEEKPSVLNITPYPGQTEVQITDDIIITFNKPVYHVDSNSFIVKNKKGERLTGSYSQFENSWTFSGLLKYNETYHVTLNKNITDETGRELKPFFFTFDTKKYEDLTIKSIKYYTSDINQTTDLIEKEGNIPLEAKILIEFSNPPVNALDNIHLNPDEYNTIQNSPTIFEIQPDIALSIYTDYTLTIDQHIHDDKGQTLIDNKALHFTTSIVPKPFASSQLVNIGNDICLLSGGFDEKGLPNEGTFKFNIVWSDNIPDEALNLRNAFPVSLLNQNKILYIGGLDANYQYTDIYELDLSTNQWTTLVTLNKPNVIDWAGVIQVWNSSSSLMEDHIACISFTGNDTIVSTLDLNTNSWSNIPLVGSQQITQAFGSFVWVNQGDSLNNPVLHLLGGMSSSNNNLPVKQWQKVIFYLDSGILKYTVNIAATENHVLFKTSLAFPNGLRTNRIGNKPEARDKFNNYGIARLRCEEVYPLDCGLYEKGSETFLTDADLKTNVLLTFFVNPPDGVVKPFIQIYETNENALRFSLPQVDFDYSYTNRTEFALTPLNIQNSKAHKLLMFGGKDGFNEYLNSCWTIEPAGGEDSTFNFRLSKINPFFTK